MWDTLVEGFSPEYHEELIEEYMARLDLRHGRMFSLDEDAPGYAEQFTLLANDAYELSLDVDALRSEIA
jgi:hypothetical protein